MRRLKSHFFLFTFTTSSFFLNTAVASDSSDLLNQCRFTFMSSQERAQLRLVGEVTTSALNFASSTFDTIRAELEATARKENAEMESVRPKEMDPRNSFADRMTFVHNKMVKAGETSLLEDVAGHYFIKQRIEAQPQLLLRYFSDVEVEQMLNFYLKDYTELITTGTNGIGLGARFWGGLARKIGGGGNGWSYNNLWGYVQKEVVRRLNDPTRNKAELEQTLVSALRRLYASYELAFAGTTFDNTIKIERLSIGLGLGEDLALAAKDASATFSAEATILYLKAVAKISGPAKATERAQNLLIYQFGRYSELEPAIVSLVIASKVIDFNSAYQGDIDYNFQKWNISGIADYYQKAINYEESSPDQLRKKDLARRLATQGMLRSFGLIP